MPCGINYKQILNSLVVRRCSKSVFLYIKKYFLSPRLNILKEFPAKFFGKVFYSADFAF